MNTVICSVPTEAPGTKLIRERWEEDGGVGGVRPKIAITSLNHWAVTNGFDDCKFYDIDMLYPTDEEIEKYFIENQADVVGLSAVVSVSFLQVKRIAKIIKKVNKNTIIVCGGLLTAASNTVLNKTKVDICVVGNGEIAWVGILKFAKEHLENGKNKLDINKLLEIKGIAILDDERNVKFSGYGETLPSAHMTFPDFEYLRSGLQGKDEAMQNYFQPFWQNPVFRQDSRSYEKNRRPMMATMFTTKGCVARCTFCQRGAAGYTTYDLGKLETYIKDLIDNYNVGFIYVDEENFGSNKKYSYKVAELFNKYGLLWWACGVRCTSINAEDVIHYKKNGCCGLRFGIETGSQTMLDIMEKKCTVADIKKAVFACYDNGLYSPPLGFMLGMPGESLRTAKESGKLLGEIAAKIRVPPGFIFGVSDIPYALPLIGTPFYEYGKQLGLIGEGVDEEEKYIEFTSRAYYHKRYYLNFNGAPLSEVIFWDMLVFLEATRTFEELIKNKTLDKERINNFITQMKLQSTNPSVRSKQKKIKILGKNREKMNLSISNYFITNFIKKYVVFNRVIAKLPRFLVDPIVRYMLYFEFLVQKNFFKDENLLHTVSATNKKMNPKIRISDEDLDPLKTTQRERSLRTIVEKINKKLNKTEQDKILDTLTRGA